MRVVRRSVIPGALALGVMVVFGTPASAVTINNCQAGKKHCVKNYVAATLKCHAEAERSGAALDPTCIQKAADRYTGGAAPAKGCFAKLEARRVCNTTGDSETLQAKTAAFISDVVTALDPGYPAPILNTCSAAKKQCVARLARALLGCHAKAEKTGRLDLKRIQKAEDDYTGGATPAKGCFAKSEAKPPCLTTDDSAAIHDDTEAYVDDVVCALDPSGGTCRPPSCGSTPYPTCSGVCDVDLNERCIPVSGQMGSGCVCVPAPIAFCPAGTALMFGLDGNSLLGCAPIPTCWEPSVTYPECSGGTPPGFACQAIAAHSVSFAGCIPVDAASPCSDTCSPMLGTCPPGQACYVDPAVGLGPCGCFAPSTQCCQGSVPSVAVNVCADVPSTIAASQCAALSNTLSAVGGSASLSPIGNVCDGSGACTGTRTSVSDCCQAGSTCTEGTGSVFDAGCGSLGGILNAGQLCTPAGGCAP